MMRLRIGLSLLLLGASVAGTLFMALVAIQNFQIIDRLLAAPLHGSFGALVDELGSAASREFLRYLASEVNRLLFQVWGWTDLAFCVAVLGLLRPVPERRLRYAAVGMFVLAGAMAVILTPMIVSVGRDLDFVPRVPPPPQLATFGLLHASYTILDGVKLLAAGFVAVGLLRLREDS